MKINKKIFLAVILAVLIAYSSLLFSQFEPGSTRSQLEQDKKEIVETKISKFDKWLLPSPTTYWVKINAFGLYSMIIIIIAFILGFVNIFIGLNAGGRANITKIRRCVIYTVVIGFFSKPICDFVFYSLSKGIKQLHFIPYEIASSLIGTLVYIVWITYLVYSGILLYESFIVTAKEAHPMQ